MSGWAGWSIAIHVLLGAVIWLAGFPALAGTSLSVKENVNYAGSDYKHFNIADGDLYACVDACRQDGACVAYTWVKPGVQGPQAVCWLKSAVPAAKNDSCCVSGVKSQLPDVIAVGPDPTVHSGLDLPGADFERTALERPDPEICRRRCQVNEKCAAYTYVKPGVQGPAAICYLKTTVPGSKSNGCCTSGIKEYASSALDKVSLAAFTNLPGSDYKNFPLDRPDPRLCADACEKDKSCRAYTFVNPSGAAKAHCWLKSVTPVAKYDKCCASGVRTPDTGLANALVRGQPQESIVSCNSGAASDIFDTLCGSVPSCESPTKICKSYVRQVAVGAVGHTVPASSAQSFAELKVFPAQGKALGEATMCALRELSPAFSVGSGGAKGGPLDATQEKAAIGALGHLSYRQRIGYLDFDPAARRFRGYRQLSVSAPIVGSYDSVAQDFSVKLDRYDIVPPIAVGPAPGGQAFALDEFYALTLETETSTKGVKLFLPPIIVPVPIGPPVSVQPRFTYSATESVIAPPMQGVSTIRREDDPKTGWRGSPLRDIHGADYGIAFPLIGWDATGWQSQLGLGNRAPAEGATVWKPEHKVPPVPPSRPDRDLRVARSDEEKKASTEIAASARLTYPAASELKNYLPSWMTGAADLVFEIWVEPVARAAFSGQFDILAANAFLFAPDIGAGGDWYGSDVTMLANASSSFGFSLKAGVILVVKFSIPTPFGSKKVTIVDWETSFKKPISEGPTQNPAASWAYFAATGAPKAASPAYSRFRTFKSDLGANAASQGAAYVDACLASAKQAPQQPPEPKYEPGDTTKLFDNDFVEVPCNICVVSAEKDPASPAYGKVEVLAKVPVPAIPNPWQCHYALQNGCHDICKYTFKTGSTTYLRGPDSSLKIHNKVDGKTRTGKDCYVTIVK